MLDGLPHANLDSIPTSRESLVYTGWSCPLLDRLWTSCAGSLDSFAPHAIELGPEPSFELCLKGISESLLGDSFLPCSINTLDHTCLVA